MESSRRYSEQCQQCRLARRLILFSQGSNSLPTSETLKTADELKEKCTGYKEELEDYEIYYRY
jgi:hypothetical protein